MSYQALYRKFRPQTFEEVRGQDAIVTTLKNQVIHNRIGHAYLFCGTRGTGKTSVAKLFAKTVNCENPKDGSPCGECAMCKSIAAGASMNVIEMDAASNNGVDDIRRIVEEVAYSPAQGKYRVYIVDEVHMLSPNAFNALLKTLEEPPSYVIFILATTEIHSIPITIQSRCQRYDFKRISIETITERMKELTDAEQIPVEDRALRYIAKCADGSMRDALSLLDQCAAFFLGNELTYDRTLEILGAVDTQVFSDLFRMVLAQDVTGAIRKLEEQVMLGRDLPQFANDFVWYMRNLLLVKTADQNIEEVIDVSSERRKLLEEEAQMVETPVLMRYIRVVSELCGQLRYATQKRTLIEVTLIKLCRPSMEKDLESLTDRIRQLEQKLESLGNGTFVPATGGGSAVAAILTEPVKPVELPAALPEEIVKVAKNWKGIQTKLDGLLKTLARSFKLSVEDDKLLFVTSDQNAYMKYCQDDTKAILKNLMEELIEKEVSFEIRLLDEDRRFEATYPDLSAAVINMDIESEE